MSYLHIVFSHLCIDLLCKLKCGACCSDWTIFLPSWCHEINSQWIQFVTESEYRKGLCFRYMWSRSGSNPHIAFTLRNLINLLGSKLPQSGSFDPHRIHIVIVVSNPLRLSSHYTGKWFRCRVDPMSLHQKVLMWTRPKIFSIFQDVFFLFVCFVFFSFSRLSWL